MSKRIMLIILDGLDVESFKKARKPNIDLLVKRGSKGLLYSIKGVAPESGEAQFVLLGHRLEGYPSRGVLEALGSGVKLKKNTVYLRGNFSSLEKNKITDTRASIPAKFIARLNRIDRDIRVGPTIGYRCVVSVKDYGTMPKNTHPGYRTFKNFSKAVSFRLPHKRKMTGCKKLDEFISQAEKILKNKTIIVRGAGIMPKKKFRQMKNWSFIADMPVEKGLGKLFKMKIANRTRNEIKHAMNLKANVYVQIKGPDSFGHKGDLKGKIKSIEKIDGMLKPLLSSKDIICITSDHATPCRLRRHSSGPVPLIISRKKMNLGNVEGKDLMHLLIKLSK